MGRPLTPADVEAIAQEAWDATMTEAGNPPWEELGADVKSRYRDITVDACKFGGVSGEFEKKCVELWATKQEEDPPAEEPEPQPAEPEEILPPGTDLTPNVLAAAIRKVAGEGEEAAEA